MEVPAHLVFSWVAISAIWLASIAVAWLIDEVGGATSEHLSPDFRHHQEVNIVHYINTIYEQINNDSFPWNLFCDDGSNDNTGVLDNTGDHHEAAT